MSIPTILATGFLFLGGILLQLVNMLLCSGFFFLGGLLLYPIVQSDEVLAPISILLGLLGGAGLLISYFSAVRQLLFKESYITPNSDHHKEDSHENT